MSIAKNKRQFKRQMGQFLTPRGLARDLVDNINFCREHKVLEPSMGDGAFILPLIAHFMPLYRGDVEAKLAQVLRHNIYGVELDATLYNRCLLNIQHEWGYLPTTHNFVCGDFLLTHFDTPFDYVIGNPPFGGSIAVAHQDALDKQFGVRGGQKIKKETYAFFIVKSMDLLRRGGRLIFICSDTFLTIRTMQGLRNFLFYQAQVEVDNVAFFSDEVSQQTVVLKCAKGNRAAGVRVDGKLIPAANIQATPNNSWRIDAALVKYFRGAKLGDFMTATSGMTVGKNEYFIRSIADGEIIEPYRFSFYARPVSLDAAVARARLGQLADTKRARIMQQEKMGITYRDVHITPRASALKIKLPHPDYCYYNKALKGLVYAPPRYVIFWRDAGDAVYTYKKNGNWYLNGVGGKKYFFREGLTWNLIASRLWLRHLPAGYVLDSGAPCAFLNDGVAREEMFFILGWGLTDLCNTLLKTCLNHTKNIQGKDFERLPYPFWVDAAAKNTAIALVQDLIKAATTGQSLSLDDARIRHLNAIFTAQGYFCDDHSVSTAVKTGRQLTLDCQV